MRESVSKMNSASAEQGLFDQQAASAFEFFNSQANNFFLLLVPYASVLD